MVGVAVSTVVGSGIADHVQGLASGNNQVQLLSASALTLNASKMLCGMPCSGSRYLSHTVCGNSIVPGASGRSRSFCLCACHGVLTR